MRWKKALPPLVLLKQITNAYNCWRDYRVLPVRSLCLNIFTQKNVVENKPDDLFAPRHDGFVHYLCIL